MKQFFSALFASLLDIGFTLLFYVAMLFSVLFQARSTWVERTYCLLFILALLGFFGLAGYGFFHLIW
jgi:hypothetical protein